MKRLVIVLFAIASLISVMAQTGKKASGSQTPDFAYPEKVASTALKDLKAALRGDDGAAVVNAVVRLGLAKSAVSSDSIKPVLARIDKVASESGEPAVKALLYLLQADVYTSIYLHDSYKINRRATVANMAGDDYDLWSKDQFLSKISALTDSALAYREELAAIPLTAYKGVVDYDRSALTFYPTLYDFAAYRAIDYLGYFNTSAPVLNRALLENLWNESLYPDVNKSVDGRILAIYRSLVEGREDSAPGVMALKNQIAYVLPRVFYAPGAVSGARSIEYDSDYGIGDSMAYDAYMRAYERCENSAYAIELLMPLADNRLSCKEEKKLYGIACDFAKSNSSYFNINAVKNLIRRLSAKKASAAVPVQAAKGVPFKIRLKAANVGKVTLKVYDVTASATQNRDNGYYNGAYYELPASLPVPRQTVEVELPGEVPFRCDTVVELTLADYGVYVVVPDFADAKLRETNYPFVACSDLSAGLVGGANRMEAVAVDPMTGAPQAGVGLRFQPWSRKVAVKTLPGLTDSAGIVDIKESTRGNITPVRGGDRYAPSFYFRPFSAWNHSERLRGAIFTDLGLYHFGDSVRFSVVAYTESGNSHAPASSREVTVELRDANFQAVDTLKLVTDEWGRGEGRFVLPSDGLSGNFALRMIVGDDFIEAHSFMVSDYKLPTFMVSADRITRPAVVGDDAVIGGNASTFAGFPVADAQVRLQLKVRSGMWIWATTSPVFYEAEATTDEKGDFSITIPGEVMLAGPCPAGSYIATVSVSSADGETHETTAGFNLGKPLTLNVNIPDVFVADGKSTAYVEVRNYDGAREETDLSYTVKAIERPLYGGGAETRREVASGICRPGDVTRLLSDLPSGEYEIVFATSDKSLAEEVSVGPVVVYRLADESSPVNRLLWIPTSVITADESGDAEIVFATAVDSPHMFMAVSDCNGNMIESRWLDVRKGMNRVRLAMPGDASSIRVYLRLMSHMEAASAAVTVNSYRSQRSIILTTSTFRDKVRPGDRETVTLKVSGLNGAETSCAVMIDMSNKAIELLAPNKLTLIPQTYGGQYLMLEGWNDGTLNFSLYGAWRVLKEAQVAQPRFNLYGRSFVPEVMFSTSRVYNSAMKIRGASVTMGAGTDDLNVVREHKMEVAVAEESADAAMEMDEAMAGAPDGGGTAENGTEVEYRPSELPLAFFRPMLTTGADGSLEISYTVPDANTTWVLQSLAYNREMQTASDKVEIVASKPVMVSVNAPRFMRCGDKVVLKASVMNALDESVEAHTVSEILDAISGKVIATTESTDSIDAMGRKVVEMSFAAPADMQGVIFRVRSSAGTFTDGEQTFMPVLPSEQNVTESEIFYIAPDESRFSLDIAPAGDGRTYLNFTENPAWQVVSALPGLRESQINSSLDAAAALFSAAVADGLMKGNPEIARTIRRWSGNPADGALHSQLEKNEELKQILLSSTPWVSDALSQTERMQRLVLLLDSHNTAAVISKAIADLERRFDSNGGWFWTKDYPEASEWCTHQILDMLGDLNRMGWLPSDGRLRSMMEKSVKWLDATTAKEYSKYPKADYSSYCYTRMKFPDIKQSTAAARVTS
ncbi:MAG: hypothetical protein K2H14_08105, partial [Muribaculaceae bacterium]|nr:hypothetical protein [Muribaculaceae bacterium]